MIVAAWFLLVAFIILVGFAVVGVTLWHWYKQSKSTQKKAQPAKTAEV